RTGSDKTSVDVALPAESLEFSRRESRLTHIDTCRNEDGATRMMCITKVLKPVVYSRQGIWTCRVEEHQREVDVIQKECVNGAKIGLSRKVPEDSLAQGTISAYRP